MQSDKLFAQSRQAVQARRAGGTSRLVPCGAGKGWFRLLWMYLPKDKASGLGEAVAPSLGGEGKSSGNHMGCRGHALCSPEQVSGPKQKPFELLR